MKLYQPQFKLTNGIWVRSTKEEFDTPAKALDYIHTEVIVNTWQGADNRGNWRVVPQGHPEYIV